MSKKTQIFCLIKSFAGGPGGRFFKRVPLVAEGREYIYIVLRYPLIILINFL